MKEFFQKRKLKGTIKITCKFENQPDRIWAAKKEDIVEEIISIVRRYNAQGYKLTLRQLHYQLVQANKIVNHQSAYSKLGDILDDCRYSGKIDWDMIEDRGRVPYIPYWADNAADAIDGLVGYFRINRQENQKNHVELWTEKDALSGIFKVTTEKYHIQLVVNKGYSSSSAIYLAYSRLIRKINNEGTVTILYFGDHDPSGLDMIRDIRERLLFFICSGTRIKDVIRWEANEWYRVQGLSIYDLVDHYSVSDKILKNMGEDSFDQKLFEASILLAYLVEKNIFKILPIGLTMDQIQKYNLPPNPAKMTDSRANSYIEKFGNISWEVDALNPEILTEIVEQHIQEQIDISLFNEKLEEEEKELEKLISARDKFNTSESEEEDPY